MLHVPELKTAIRDIQRRRGWGDSTLLSMVLDAIGADALQVALAVVLSLAKSEEDGIMKAAALARERAALEATRPAWLDRRKPDAFDMDTLPGPPE